MEWDEEKKLLSLMDEARIIDGKLMPEYEKIVKSEIKINDKELCDAVKDFVKKGLLKEMRFGENDFIYIHTSKVNKDVIDGTFLNVGKEGAHLRR